MKKKNIQFMRSKFCIFTGHKNEKHLILHHAINPFSASYTGLQVFFFKKLSLVTFSCKVFAIKEICSQRKNICYIKRRTFHVGSPEFICLISQPNIYGFFEVFFEYVGHFHGDLSHQIFINLLW